MIIIIIQWYINDVNDEPNGFYKMLLKAQPIFWLNLGHLNVVEEKNFISRQWSIVNSFFFVIIPLKCTDYFLSMFISVNWKSFMQVQVQ